MMTTKNAKTLDKSGTETSPVALPQAAYIHLPFCRQRCFYCDFPIVAVGPRQDLGASSLVEKYEAALIQEIATATGPAPLTSIFFGGGTPSLFPLDPLERLLVWLEKQFGFGANLEMSLEIDPGTFDLAQLRRYQALGVNRLSLGVQAFQDRHLTALGRHHRRRDIDEAINLIHQAGFENWSLDLISGLPGQTLEDWCQSLTEALAAGPSHLSCYDLVVEPGTVFGKRFQPETVPLPPQESTAQMYSLAHETLTQVGFDHYEISNYARPGRQCRHNLVYWRNQPYYGFGLGAASYLNGVRLTRPRTRAEYYAWVNELPQAPEPPLSRREQLLETLMLGLRLREGVDLKPLLKDLSPQEESALWRCLEPYFKEGYGEIFDPEDHRPGLKPGDNGLRLRLTAPEGFLRSNRILAALFAVL
ncbi:MAG: radical SAM family heme chaperone HemW [Cyanobacteriota bacterium]|jgi:putative oxygen-independent coproporphyrinogen III oxidase